MLEDRDCVSLILGLLYIILEGPGNPFEYSCLEKVMDREAWRATVHRVAESWTQLSTHALLIMSCELLREWKMEVMQMNYET